ncbi:MAG TPA: potassium/proton antiporter [Ramlibacter sp.]|nr:potassium/proton antiporter [Ramlibacter sp.]
MDFVNVPLFAAAALVFLCVLSGLFSTRFGFSFLLVFLLAGVLAGEDGPGGLRFDDFTLSFWVGNLALAVILLDGGMRTSFSTFRTGLKPSLLLATVGVVLTALLTGIGATLLLDIGWRHGMLLGAIVGSTDAAAVFALLKKCGVTLNERVGTTLEIESGMNDPMAVYLTLAFIALLVATGASGADELGTALWSFLRQFGLGALAGVGAGMGLAFVLRRVPTADAGITALLLVSAGLMVFAATGWAGGSGFLAVYLFGMIVANRAGPRVASALAAMDGYAWLAQAGMFLLLGLLVTPSEVVRVGLPALGVAAILMLIARPLTVWLCLAPFNFRPQEVWFISWVGLRGAVPIVLAVFPLMAGVPGAMLLFNVAFVVVFTSLVLQGTTIGLAARRLDVALPEPHDRAGMRKLFGDFVLDGAAPLAAVCAFYGLPMPAGETRTVGEWMAGVLGRAAIVGDQVRLGPATLAVRGMKGDAILMVGLKLPAEAADGKS